MVDRLRRFVCLVPLLLLFLATGCGDRGGPTGSDSTSGAHGEQRAGGGSASGRKYRLAVIPKGTTHEFWKSVHYGAVQAGDEMGAEILWLGPLLEMDRGGQIDVVQNFITQARRWHHPGADRFARLGRAG